MLQARPDGWSGSIRLVLGDLGFVKEALFGGQFIKGVFCMTSCPWEKVGRP